MARQAITSYNVTDDLSHVTEAPKADGMRGAKLNANGMVRIAVTDRDSVWVLDTARRNVIVELLKQAGTKQGKRGRKPASATQATETEQESDEEVAAS